MFSDAAIQQYPAHIICSISYYLWLVNLWNNMSNVLNQKKLQGTLNIKVPHKVLQNYNVISHFSRLSRGSGEMPLSLYSV